MDWQAIGVIVAMVAVAISFLMTWRGQKQEKEIAENSAARAEAAARLTADNTERVVAALEGIAAKDFGSRGPSSPAPAKVSWSLTHHAGDTYMLTNTGAATAYGVEVGGHETLIGPDRVTGGPDLSEGEALTFMAVRSLATQDSTITVTWLDDPTSTEPHEWRYPLPARPPRG